MHWKLAILKGGRRRRDGADDGGRWENALLRLETIPHVAEYPKPGLACDRDPNQFVAMLTACHHADTTLDIFKLKGFGVKKCYDFHVFCATSSQSDTSHTSVS